MGNKGSGNFDEKDEIITSLLNLYVDTLEERDGLAAKVDRLEKANDKNVVTRNCWYRKYVELATEYEELAANYNKRYGSDNESLLSALVLLQEECEAMDEELSTNKQTLEVVIDEKNELWQAITAIGDEFDRYADKQYDEQAALKRQLKTSRQLETKLRHEVKVLRNIIDRLQGVEQ